jgi:hypothetical protein
VYKKGALAVKRLLLELVAQAASPPSVDTQNRPLMDT